MKKASIGVNCVLLNSTIPSKHAEENALHKLDRLNKYRRFVARSDVIDVFVIRLTKSGVLGYSHPCKNCLIRMNNCKFKIGNIYYSTAEGEIAVEKFQTMLDSPLTRFSKGTVRAQCSREHCRIRKMGKKRKRRSR